MFWLSLIDALKTTDLLITILTSSLASQLIEFQYKLKTWLTNAPNHSDSQIKMSVCKKFKLFIGFSSFVQTQQRKELTSVGVGASDDTEKGKTKCKAK